jgi:alanine-glyoxylate transaminase / serine-glyoxylate transaminase / serine-pyruvate transaminase
VPEGIDWLKLNAYVMDKYRLEIAGGLGPSANICWRIGIMGFNATPVSQMPYKLEDSLSLLCC